MTNTEKFKKKDKGTHRHTLEHRFPELHEIAMGRVQHIEDAPPELARELARARLRDPRLGQCLR